jgi:small subunit ribosomal protein S6
LYTLGIALFLPTKIKIMNHYETVFILNPVLSETQIEEAVQKYVNFISAQGGTMTSQENWGLKKLAYPIENKKSGFYHLFEFAAPAEVIATLEVDFRRDERVMRYLTVKLDKHALAWAEKRRKRNKEKA